MLGIDVSVQNLLGPQVYGNYFSLLNFAFLFTVVLDFGLNNYTNRKISMNPELMPKLLVQTSFVKLQLLVLFGVVLFISASIIGYTEMELSLLKLIALMLFLQSFLMFLRANLSGIQWYRADVLMSVLDKSLMIIIVGAMLWTSVLDGEFNIGHFILGQCLAYALAIITVTGLLVYKSNEITTVINWTEVKETLKESAPYALLTFLMLVYFKIDAVMIERMLDDGDIQAGIYAQGYKLLEAAVMFAFLFSSLLLPMFSHLLGRKESVSSLVHLSSRLMLIPVSVLAIIVVTYSADLMKLMYQSQFEYSAQVLPYLILTLIPLGSSYIFGTLITAQGNLRFLNKVAVLAIAVNVAINWVLIPRIGIEGAAIATLITQAFVAIVQWLACSKDHGLSYGLSDYIRALSFLAIMATMSYYSISIDLEWWVKALCLLTLGGVLSFMLKILTVSYIKTFLNYQK